MSRKSKRDELSAYRKAKLIYPTSRPSQPRKPKKPRKVARHRLREKLVQLIVEGKFLPGDRLIQSRLAKRFGVSISLIREALLDLQTFGLVETDDNRGIFVRSLDARTMLDTYDVREALEGMAARKCCGKISSEELEELENIVDRMYEAGQEGNHELRAELDRHFHNRIYEIADNRMILLLAQQCLLFGKVVWTNTDLEGLRREHMKIVEAIRRNDAEAAERLARASVVHGKGEMMERMEAGGEGIYWLEKPFDLK